jgi:hypothetical protein
LVRLKVGEQLPDDSQDLRVVDFLEVVKEEDKGPSPGCPRSA